MAKILEKQKLEHNPITQQMCSSCTLGGILRFIMLKLSGCETKYGTIQSISSLFALLPKCSYNKLLVNVSNDLEDLINRIAVPEYVCGTQTLPNEYLGFDVRPLSEVLRLIFPILEKTTPMTDQDKMLLMVVICGFNVACRKNFILRKYLRRVIFPPILSARVKPELQQNFRGYFVRNIRHEDEKLGNTIADFLYTICRRNLGRLVKHCGMVNLIGYLMNVGLFGNEEAVDKEEQKYLQECYDDDSDDSEAEECEEEVDNMNDMLGVIKEDNVDVHKETPEELLDKLTKLGLL